MTLRVWPNRSRLLTPALAGVFVWLAALLLSGCATPQASQMQAQWPSDIPAQAELTHVPFIAQDDYQCGPAALAMVLQSAGVLVTDQQLVEQVYVPARRGALQVEMLATSRRYGLPAYALAPEVAAVLREVAAGNPVLVLQNLSLPAFAVWHYAVVVGYDRWANTLTLHSGRTERMAISLFAFERTWQRGGYWAMVALPPDRLPATAHAAPFASAVAALERVHPAPALLAYQTALRKWPQEKLLLFGAGNAAYAQGKLELATQMYRATTHAQPDFADAWNNLAQVLYEQDQLPDAAQAITHAVALGGPRLAQYQTLQRDIARKNQSDSKNSIPETK